MLKELHIRNFALIDAVDLEFAHGLNLLTGETGAGKSILIDALGLVLGDRASGVDCIRTGASAALVEALFSLDDASKEHREKIDEAGFLDEDDPDILIASREIAASGKSQCRINGRLCPVSLLREICRPLVDIHGQHEHQAILISANHIDILDNWLGAAALGLREQAAICHETILVLQRNLDKLKTDSREKARSASLLQFQIEEIDAAQLTIGEEEEIEAERTKLGSAEKLTASSRDALESLSSSAQDGLSSALSHLSKIKIYDDALDSILEKITNAIDLTSDAKRELRRYADSVEYNPERLAEIDDRLHAIRQLKRKYGETIEEILAYAAGAKSQLSSIENDEALAADFEAKIERFKNDLGKISARLTLIRKEGGKRFSEHILQELSTLGMSATRFMVQIDAQQPASKGADQVEFMLSPNPGEPIRPLAKIASGGEASRIMLSIKSVLAKSAIIPTLIFDEIDTGIGGRTAMAVAAKLESLAQKTQILCISHLPQIASRAASKHFMIQKSATDDKTTVSVYDLTGDERVLEVARMLGGAPGEKAVIDHARQLLSQGC